MAEDQTDIAALVQDLADRIRVLETQAPLEASSIGSGGVRIYDGGSIKFDGGNIAPDIALGVVGGQNQIRFGDSVFFAGFDGPAGDADYMVMRLADVDGVEVARLTLRRSRTSLVNGDSKVVLDEEFSSLRHGTSAVVVRDTGIFVAGVTDGTPLKYLAVDGTGKLVLASGGTGPPPPGTWAYPFPLSDVSYPGGAGEFGPRDGRFHEAMDFGFGGATSGAEIHSIGPGTVVESGWHSADGFGNWVVVDHGDRNISGTMYTLKTVYGHMLRTPPVSVGTTVTSATVLGQVGNTGASFGAHLHLETHLCAAGGGSIIWRTNNPSWDAGRTAANPRTVMSALGATGG